MRAASSVARRLMLRTGQGPLGRVWELAYEALMRGIARYVMRGHRGGTAYVGGSMGHGEPVYGVSDVDMILVPPGDQARVDDARPRMDARWRRLCRALPLLPSAVEGIYIYGEDELRDAAAETCLTYGLDGHGGARATAPALMLNSSAPRDEAKLRFRPGLWPTVDWRLLSGPDRRPGDGLDRQHYRITAWLELQFWWRRLFLAVAEPGNSNVAYVCVKLVAEPARILIWLAHGERLYRRTEILERALRLIPEEERAIRAAQELHSRLARDPEPPISELLPSFVRVSARIGRLVEAEVAAAGTTEARLFGGDPAGLALPPVDAEGPNGSARLLPLLDWRALVAPSRPPDEAMLLLAGDASDVTLIARAIAIHDSARRPAVPADGLVAFPSVASGAVRAVQCPATAPVSFAVMRGEELAGFPNVAGWSLKDIAERAVAEHRAGLAELEEPAGAPVPRSQRRLGLGLTAARAALLAETLEEGAPELALTVSALVERLGARHPGVTGVLADALGEHRVALANKTGPLAETCRALETAVRRLPAYAR